MKYILFIILLNCYFLNAGEIKITKDAKKKELSKEDDEWLKDMQSLDNQIQEEKNRQSKLEREKIETKAKTTQLQKEVEETKEIGKTLDEIKNKLNVK